LRALQSNRVVRRPRENERIGWRKQNFGLRKQKIGWDLRYVRSREQDRSRWNYAGVIVMIRTWLASVAIAGVLAAPGVANAAIEDLTISGKLDGYSYTGTLSLDVAGGLAISGTGTLSIVGLTNAPLVLITTSTPGNEYHPLPSGPVGFRANDGADYFNLDQAYPIDAAYGLLFDVNTTTPEWGAYPLFAIWSNTPQEGYSAAFTGMVDGVDYYNIQGSAAVSSAPEPSTWAMMLLGFAGLGFAGFRQTRKANMSIA
jgi:PEP-CTERM motif